MNLSIKEEENTKLEKLLMVCIRKIQPDIEMDEIYVCIQVVLHLCTYVT